MSAVPSSPTLCVVDDSDPLVGKLADVLPAPSTVAALIAFSRANACSVANVLVKVTGLGPPDGTEALGLLP